MEILCKASSVIMCPRATVCMFVNMSSLVFKLQLSVALRNRAHRCCWFYMDAWHRRAFTSFTSGRNKTSLVNKKNSMALGRSVSQLGQHDQGIRGWKLRPRTRRDPARIRAAEAVEANGCGRCLRGCLTVLVMFTSLRVLDYKMNSWRLRRLKMKFW